MTAAHTMQEKDVHVHVSLVLVMDLVGFVTKDIGGLFVINNRAKIVYFLHKIAKWYSKNVIR